MEDIALHRLRSAALNSLPPRKGGKYEEKNSFERLQRKRKQLEAVVRQNRPRHYPKDNGYRYKDPLPPLDYIKSRSFSSSRSSRSASRSSYSSSSSSRSSSTSNSSSGSYSRSNSKSSHSVSPLGKRRGAHYDARERYHEPRKRARYATDRRSPPHVPHVEMHRGPRNPERRPPSHYSHAPSHAPSHRGYDKPVPSRSKAHYSSVPTQLSPVHDKRSYSRGHRYERDTSIRSGRYADSDRHTGRSIEKPGPRHPRSKDRGEYRSPHTTRRPPSSRMDSNEDRWGPRSAESRVKSPVRHVHRERIHRSSRKREDKPYPYSERPRRGHESDVADNYFVVEDSVVENRQSEDSRQVEGGNTAVDEDDAHKHLSEAVKEESDDDGLESIGSLGDIAPDDPVDSDIVDEGLAEELDYNEDMDNIEHLSSPQSIAASPKKDPEPETVSDWEQGDNNTSDAAELSNNCDGKEVRPISSPLRVSSDGSDDGGERYNSSQRIPVKQRLFLSKRKIEERRRQNYEPVSDLRPSLANRLGPPQQPKRSDYQSHRGGRRLNNAPTSTKGSAIDIARAHRRKKKAYLS